jgi:hypothetical protein
MKEVYEIARALADAHAWRWADLPLAATTGKVTKAVTVDYDERTDVIQLTTERADSRTLAWLRETAHVVEPVKGWGVYTHLVIAPDLGGGFDYWLVRTNDVRGASATWDPKLGCPFVRLHEEAEL